jgi:hypothetical protein
MNPSAHAMSTPDPRPESRRPPLVLRYFDVLLILAALVVFLVAGLPIVAWAAVSVVWAIQRGVQVWAESRANTSRDPKAVAGLMVGSTIARAFMVVLTIFAVGAGDRHRGLCAVLLFVALFTLYFPVSLLLRRHAAER